MDFGSSSSRFPRHFEHQHEPEQQQQQQQDRDRDRDRESMECNNSIFVEKEHMFDKVVTPSDVGKLNRLVIPKQHAEKYFPLDSSSNEKGLLLNFEDRSGKSWRFRYSYWTSSQSYVMTKGWSRFVKEKRLDAGDIVSFQRGLGDVGKDRFFIDWRRRPPHTAMETAINFHHQHQHGGGGQIPHHFQVQQWATPLSLHRDHVLHLPQNNSNHNNVTLFHNPYWNNHHYHHHHHHPNHPILGVGGGGGGGGGDGSYGEPSLFYHLRSAATSTASEAVPIATGGSGGIGKNVAAKTLRLFGVDMECAVSEESDDECDVTTSTTTMSSSSPQFRIYNGTPMSMPMSMQMQMQNNNNNNNVPTTDFFEKGKSSMSSLDFGT